MLKYHEEDSFIGDKNRFSIDIERHDGIGDSVPTSIEISYDTLEILDIKEEHGEYQISLAVPFNDISNFINLLEKIRNTFDFEFKRHDEFIEDHVRGIEMTDLSEDEKCKQFLDPAREKITCTQDRIEFQFFVEYAGSVTGDVFGSILPIGVSFLVSMGGMANFEVVKNNKNNFKITSSGQYEQIVLIMLFDYLYKNISKAFDIYNQTMLKYQKKTMGKR